VVEGETGGWKARLKALGIVRKRGGRKVSHDPRKIVQGRGGEEVAARHLEERGVVIVERNVRYRDGEIDLVAREGTTLLFVEVKRRRTQEFGSPEEAVGPRKRARVIRAARRWLARAPRGAREVRFDVVAIQDEPPRVDWIRGAFDAAP